MTEFNVNSPEFQDLELLVKTMRAAGAEMFNKVFHQTVYGHDHWYR